MVLDFGTQMEPQPLSHTLFIREVSATGFIFHLSLIDGARAGNVAGICEVHRVRIQRMLVSTERTSGGHVKSSSGGRIGDKRQIQVEESLGCRFFKGMGASFEWDYMCRGDLLFDSRALDELDLQRLYGITGQYYRPLLDRFQQVGTRRE